MSERFLTNSIYPRIKNISFDQKKPSISILNITQKTTSNTKLDYSSILSQIKEKTQRNHKANLSIYHNSNL